MTAETPLEIAPPPPWPRVQWRRARRALGWLIEDPERTEQVFELIDALAGQSGERLFQRFLRDENERPLLREKPSRLTALPDLDALEALPEGSFGRAYARFMREGGPQAHTGVHRSELHPQNAEKPTRYGSHPRGARHREEGSTGFIRPSPRSRSAACPAEAPTWGTSRSRSR